MISYLKGIYKVCTPYEIIIETQEGVGYGVEMPLSSICKLPQRGSFIELWIYTYVREDIIKLYGFLSYFEKLMFEIFLSLNGVGPKVALAILSTLDIENIERAIHFSRQDIFESVPGVGPRLAEKILVELKSKIKKIKLAKQLEYQLTLKDPNIVSSFSNTKSVLSSDITNHMEIAEDIISALENLGFKEKNISNIVFDICKQFPNDSFQDLLKKALMKLRNNNIEKRLAVDTSQSSSALHKEDILLQKDLF